jgi:hypothetical protein
MRWENYLNVRLRERADTVVLAEREPDGDDAQADDQGRCVKEMWARMLMLAVLDYWFGKGGSFRSARDWIFYSLESQPNSFDNVVRFLGLDPRMTRRAIADRYAEFDGDPSRAADVLSLLSGQGDGTRSPRMAA